MVPDTKNHVAVYLHYVFLRPPGDIGTTMGIPADAVRDAIAAHDAEVATLYQQWQALNHDRDDDRARNSIHLRLLGERLDSIGSTFGVSRQYVHILLKGVDVPQRATPARVIREAWYTYSARVHGIRVSFYRDIARRQCGLLNRPDGTPLGSPAPYQFAPEEVADWARRIADDDASYASIGSAMGVSPAIIRGALRKHGYGHRRPHPYASRSQHTGPTRRDWTPVQEDYLALMPMRDICAKHDLSRARIHQVTAGMQVVRSLDETLAAAAPYFAGAANAERNLAILRAVLTGTPITVVAQQFGLSIASIHPILWKWPNYPAGMLHRIAYR